MPGMVLRCVRCRANLERATTNSLHRTAAFSLAALILFIPANIFPILRMRLYGATAENTILDGCVRLWRHEDYVISIIVFLASIFIPLLKLLGLFFLVVTTARKSPSGQLRRTRVYQFIESIGRWAMLDVFVLAVLVSLVKLRGLATIIPGEGLLAFTGVVVFTLLASASFDPRLIWRPEGKQS